MNTRKTIVRFATSIACIAALGCWFLYGRTSAPRARSQDPLEVFVEAKLKQLECMKRGDVRTGNRHADRQVAAALQLLAGGAPAIDRFATLLHHESPDVRVAAAAWLLKDRTEQAVATLRPIAETKGLAALGAIYTLKRYEKGDLEIK